jgi:subtilisin family serine protease
MRVSRRLKSARRCRPFRLVAERLEARCLLAADLPSGIRQIMWEGETVSARADGWIVTTGGAAPQTASGWSTRSLGEGIFSVTAPGASVSDVTAWSSSIGARSLEPDRIITSAALPNDPSFSRLWGLHNTGQTGGVVDADIDAAEAWNVTTGSRSVVVGVIDTGVDYRHADLAANMWRNPGEVAGDGIDNDRNGFVDDVYGWDFANNDSDPFDDEGHGTHVAGTIGAVGNNSAGVAGVNWQVSIMALKFLGADGSGTTSAAVAALNYATMMRQSYGVNVVATNNSWGGGGASTALTNAIVAGGNAGILTVAAAGNESTNNDTTPSYPANVNSTAVISVAATDASNRLASFSNYGATTVDVAAPGVGIYSTTPNNTYASYSGTSMATPHVAGLVALMAAANPQATASQIRSAILSTAVPIASLAGKVATGGLINAAAAVNAIRGAEPPPPPPPPPPSTSGEPNDSIGTATAITLSSGAASVSGTIGDGTYGAADVDFYAVSVAAGAVLTVDIDAATLGSSLDSYVRVFNASGAQVAFNDDAGGSYDSLVTYSAATSGTYFIGVSSYGNSSYAATTAGSGRAGSTTGTYTAKIGVVAPVLPAPTADIIDVSPDPRTTSVSAVVVQFTRAVTGVNTADFSLTRGGTAVSLAGASVTTTDNIRWTLAGLDAATATAGNYVLTLNASGSGIVAVDGGAALTTSASDAWTTQTATLVDAGDTLARSAALGITSGEVRLSGRIGDGSFGSKDVDLFKVTLAAGQTITIDIDAKTLSGGSSLDSYVRLFNASGKQIAANDDDRSTYDSLLSVRVATGGTYYVGISGYGNSGYNPTRGGSGRAGSTGVYQVRFALTATTARAGARITGFRDTGAAARLTAFAMYGANWSAALPADSSGPARARRR